MFLSMQHWFARGKADPYHSGVEKMWLKKKTKKIKLNKQLMLEIYPTGFTLWDIKEGRWILDASSITKNNQLEMSNHRDFLFFKKKKYYKWADNITYELCLPKGDKKCKTKS